MNCICIIHCNMFRLTYFAYCFPETYTTYCIIGIVIFIIIGVIVGIVYFLIQHPKLAHALHKAIEAEKDDKDATPLKNNTAVINELAKIINKTSTTAPKSSYDGDEWSF